MAPLTEGVADVGNSAWGKNLGDAVEVVSDSPAVSPKGVTAAPVEQEQDEGQDCWWILEKSHC